jgi:uncharacterized membrane protein YeaQ/YmgE (transglycosylase-associated protein family)
MAEIITVPAIIAVCFLIGEIAKKVSKETINRFVPEICGVSGAILGVVAFFTIPAFIPADNWLTALAVGIVSGFAATGIHQIYKQAKKES